MFIVYRFGVVTERYSPGPNEAHAAPFGELPAGFTVSVFASGLHIPRFVSFSPNGDLYVAEFGLTNNQIKVLPDANHDGKADRVITFASGFTSPNNVAFHGGYVYVGELSRIWKLQDTTGDLVADTRSVLIDNLPADGRHKTKTVEFGPDGKLYLNVGSYNDDAAEAPGRVHPAVQRRWHGRSYFRIRPAQHRWLRLGTPSRARCGAWTARTTWAQRAA